MVFASSRNGARDLFFASRNGAGWMVVEIAELNTAGTELDPDISPDGLELMFVRRTGLEAPTVMGRQESLRQ